MGLYIYVLLFRAEIEELVIEEIVWRI